MKDIMLFIVIAISSLGFCAGIGFADTIVGTEPRHRVKRSEVDSTQKINSSLEIRPEWKNTGTIMTSNIIPLIYNVSLPEGEQKVSITINTTLDGWENIFSLCNVTVSFIGVDIQLSATTMITSVQSTAGLHVSYKVDSAVIDFGEVNVTDYISYNSLSTTVEIQFDAIVVNSSAITTGQEYNISVTTVLDEDEGNHTDYITFVANQPSSLWSVVPPLFSLNGPSVVTIGDLITWTLRANLRDAVNKIQVVAWVNGTYTSPGCHISMANTGSNYPCLNPNSFVATKTKNDLWFDIPTVINTGFNDNNTVSPDDDIQIDILTKLPTYLTSADNVTLYVVVYLDDKEAWAIKESITLTSGSLPTTSDVAQLNLGTLSGFQTLAKGASSIFAVNVTAAPGSISTYNVTIETNAGVSCISSVNLMSIGANLCMSDVITVTYSSTDGSSNMNKAVVVTDSAASLITNDDPNGAAYQFVLEFAVCVPDNSTISIGSSVAVSVDVIYEASKTLHDSVSLNIVNGIDSSLATGVVSFPNASTITGNISHIVIVPQLVQISQTVDAFNLSIVVPTSVDSALASIKGISLKSAGRNFACFPSTVTELETTIISHTQIQQALYSLGYISNTGTTNRSSAFDWSPEDDFIKIEITLQVLDHVMNTQGSLITITSSMTAGTLDTTWSGNSFISVGTSGAESPVLAFDIILEPYADPKISGDNLTMHVNIYHGVNSTAHAQDVIVHLMTPHYIGFLQLLSVDDANITIDSSTPEFGIKLQISEIDFNDNVSISISVVLDSTRVLPMGVSDLKTTIPVDMTYRGPIRSDRLGTGYLHSGVKVLELSFDTEQVGPIGLSTGLIQDCQITASSWLDTNTPADARLHTGVGWKPNVRGVPFCGQEYLQIDLGALAVLTGLKIQSSTNDYTDIPTSFILQHSIDGNGWLDVYDVDNSTPKNLTIDVTSGSSVNDVYDIELSPRLTTKHVRLVPSASKCLIGLRVELMGILTSVPNINCSVSSPGNQLAERMYLVNTVTGTIFVCGSSGVDGPIYCSRSDEAGDVWYHIDDSVSNVVGTITNTSIVIGLSHDATSHMVSFDDGFTWEVVSGAELSLYTSDPGYISAVEFPNVDTRGQTFDSIYSMYGIDGDIFSLTGCTDGIAVKKTGGTWVTKAWWGTQEASTIV